MATEPNSNDAPSPWQALTRVGSVAVVGIAIGSANLFLGWGVPCPFRAITGWLCPFCGGTHLAVCVLRGDLAGAWLANPALLVLLVLVGVRTVGWLVEFVRAPRQPSRRWLPVWWSRHAMAVFVVVSVAYVIARNLFSLG